MNRPLLSPLAATFAALALAASASAQIISINFHESTTNLDQQIDGAETFGIITSDGISTVVGNWVNYRSGTVPSLVFSDGSPSTAIVASAQFNQQASFNAHYANTPLISGYDTYTTTTGNVFGRVRNLAATFPNGYLAVVYVNGYNAAVGATNHSSISDGTTTYYFRAPNANAVPPEGFPAINAFTQTTVSTDPGVGNAPIAQYAVFGSIAAPLFLDEVTFTPRALSGGGVAIAGIQIIGLPIPEPSTYLLLGVAALVGLAVWHRRRA